MGTSSTSSNANPSTTNTDRRLAVSDGQGVTGDNSTAIDNSVSNSDEAIKYIASQGSDTVQALADAGANIIQRSGGAVLDLARFQGSQNLEAFDTLVTRGSSLIDKMIDKSSEGLNLASKVVDNFTPTDNKQADSTKYLYIAGALVAGALLLKGQK